MIKTVLFILFIGGFSFNDGNNFHMDRYFTNPYHDCKNNSVYIGSTNFSSGADIYFIQSKKELVEKIKENRERNILIYDLKQGCTIGFEIESVVKKWKETIEKEETVDYNVRLK